MFTKHQSLALGLLSLLNGACANPPDLVRTPWHGNVQGSHALTGKMGLFTLYSADSDLLIESEPGELFGEPPIEEELETEMIGRFGLGVGYQHFVLDDLALTVGLEGRYTATKVIDPPLAPPYTDPFDPSTTISGTPIFEPGDVLQLQASVGSRWWLPHAWGPESRMRPFIGFDLNYIPQTKFDVVATILDNPDSAPPLLLQDSFEFKGSPYWSLGLCFGLSYQWSDEVVAHLTVFKETALSKSVGINTLNVEFPEEFNIDIPPLPSTTTVDADGWIGFFSLSWGF